MLWYPLLKAWTFPPTQAGNLVRDIVSDVRPHKDVSEELFPMFVEYDLTPAFSSLLSTLLGLLGLSTLV